MHYPKHLSLILVYFLFSSLLFSQQGYRIKLGSKAIGSSGVNATLPDGIDDPRQTWAEDSSDVYMSKFNDTLNKFHFSYILVKLRTPFTEKTKKKDMEIVLKDFLESLKYQFNITEYWGYGSGYTSEYIPGAFAVIDFWKDKEGMDWAVKAWVSKQYIAVMMVYGKGDYPVFDIRQAFFDGVRFPK